MKRACVKRALHALSLVEGQSVPGPHRELSRLRSPEDAFKALRSGVAPGVAERAQCCRP